MAILLGTVAMACGPDRRPGADLDGGNSVPSNDGGEETADGGPDASTPQPSCDGVEPVASLAARCCPTFGVDACGPGLFCAAHDGRQFAACYALHSRLDDETCGADDECLSYRCSLTTGRCASSPNASCTTANGCGPGPGTQNYVCAGGTCRPSTGAVGAPCGLGRDCASRICHRDKCSAGAEGDACDDEADCVSNRCVTGACSDGGVGDRCASPADCTSGFCVSTRCTSGADGEGCTRATDCASGHCVRNQCASGTLGSECAATTDCDGDLRCDRPCSGTSSCDSICTDGAAGSPCLSDAVCDEGLLCSDDVRWPPGTFFPVANTCSAVERCSFTQNNCHHAGTSCMRTADGGRCLPFGTEADLAPCAVDADCRSGICEDYGDGVRLCSASGTWGAPCSYTNPSQQIGDERSAGCTTGYRCQTPPISGNGIGTAYGTCGGDAGFICWVDHGGEILERHGGCATGGLAGCKADPWNRKVCDQARSTICTNDAGCGGSPCVALMYCR